MPAKLTTTNSIITIHIDNSITIVQDILLIVLMHRIDIVAVQG
jgi:hypothetical protein